MSLNVRLSAEYESKFNQIIAMTRMNKSQLIKKMIDDHWVALQSGRSEVCQVFFSRQRNP